MSIANIPRAPAPLERRRFPASIALLRRAGGRLCRGPFCRRRGLLGAAPEPENRLRAVRKKKKHEQGDEEHAGTSSSSLALALSIAAHRRHEINLKETKSRM
jgi:hypothetical protein